MNGNISLGRIGGVQVRVSWSWLVIFALIVWTLADGVFPSQNPGLSRGTHLAMAIVAAVLFFVSILLHELGHAWQARREGLEVDGITLWLFGGVSQFKSGFPSAGAEFRIAIAGPLVSLGLGGVFVLIALAGLPSAVDGVAAWLGYINLALLVFNLIPALPLDGGRVLRAALWQSRGDLAWATRIGTDVGRVFGYLFIGLGLAMFIFQGSFSGAWLAFIGWFLLQAATAEARYIATEAALDGLRVRDLMTRDPVTVDGNLTVGQFMDEVARSRRFTTYPVFDGERPIGLLAFSSVAALPRSEWDSRRVRDAMLPLERVPLLTENETAIEALTALSSPTSNRGLVVENEHLAGLLSITDLTRALELRRSLRPSGARPQSKLGV
ncbi:MAG: CBS domain-containing protein [Actinobacteria bacterium]|nr:MAG: CBS domain-containing protein [Actinomycetota bacterium]